MGRSKIAISRTVLEDLYRDRGWPPVKIGKKLGCSHTTVRNRLCELEIPLRTKSQAHNQYQKYDFSGHETEQAYLLGFRYGDLNVYIPKGNSEIIVARCHSTQRAQELLFKRLFERYGHITVSRNTYSAHMNCYLNSSFQFLVKKFNKDIRAWLLKRSVRMHAFTAGYVDAEGTFGINQNKGRFKIDAYDADILDMINEHLLSDGIKTRYLLLAKQGEEKHGTRWNKDLWRLNINEAASLEHFINTLLPYLQHQKRVKDAGKVLHNIAARRYHGTIE